MIMLHGDDKGLVVPPMIAPIQVVIVPIFFKGRNTDAILQRARSLGEQLTKAGLSVQVDSREQYTPGWKFNEWELKGVPLRREIGPRDLERKQVVLARRDNLQKTTVQDETAVDEAKRFLEAIQQDLFSKAKSLLTSSIYQPTNYGEFKDKLAGSGGFMRACWCGSAECESTIKDETGATIRTIPFGEEKQFAGCIHCGEPATKVVYFAKSY